MPKVTILRQSCKGIDDCGICIFVCPEEILIESGEMNELGYCPPNVVNESRCTGCRRCMISCPDFAVVVETDRSGPRENEGYGED